MRLTIRCFLNLSKVRLLQDSWMGQTSVERLDVLQTSFPPLPSWIQDGEVGSDVIQDLGRFFGPPLRWWKMAALPFPVAILDDLISVPRSSKMAAGSGRAAIFHLHLNGGPKNLPILLMHPYLAYICDLYNSLAPGRHGSTLKGENFKLSAKSVLLQVMVWCCPSASHYFIT